MINKILIFLASLFCTGAECKQYDLVVCAIFQNDAKWLPEWIEFHKSQGVEHFYLYDNLSTDKPQKILKPYIKAGLVEIILWPFAFTEHTEWTGIQCGAYMHCVEHYGKKCKWIAFLDTDEFIFCPDGGRLTKLLSKHKAYGSVSACWRMYGTSNLTIPEGGKLIDYLLYRAKDDNGAHTIRKTIAQPKDILQIVNPHYCVLKNKVDKPLPIEQLRINHYWSRDMDFFHNVKLPRRERWYHDNDVHIKMESEMNEVYDPILSSDSNS